MLSDKPEVTDRKGNVVKKVPSAEDSFKNPPEAALKNLTVKPIRFQQETPRNNLKKTIKFEIKLDKVKPLVTQVAGHGSQPNGHINGETEPPMAKHCGMLLHDEGFVLKPVQGPPKGQREVEFYQHISSSLHPVDVQFYNLVPKFYGTETIKENSFSHTQYLILQDLTQGMLAPCVMDIKIGAKTYGPDASESKRRQEDSKYLGTKKPLGFSVLGIINRSEKTTGFQKLDKSYGLNLTADSVAGALNIFLNPQENPQNTRLVAAKFSQLLAHVAEFFGAQSLYHVYASSLLFVYDFSCLKQSNPLEEDQLEKCVRLKMIDFAHVFPANGVRDENFLFGLENVRKLFAKFIAS